MLMLLLETFGNLVASPATKAEISFTRSVHQDLARRVMAELLLLPGISTSQQEHLLTRAKLQVQKCEK